jgi:hypothetical protein
VSTHAAPQAPGRVKKLHGKPWTMQARASRKVRSTADLQRNLTNLAAFKMILESHSLKTAFARFHLTTPQTLARLRTEREATAAARQVDALERQLAVIQALDRGDFDSLRELGFRVEAAPPDGAAVAVNGEAPAREECSAPTPSTSSG